MAELRLILDPALGVTLEDFVRQWQRTGKWRDWRRPRSSGRRDEFGDTAWIAVLAGIVLGVPSNALWDGIKHTYARLAALQQREPVETEFIHIKQPDGTEITLLRVKR